MAPILDLTRKPIRKADFRSDTVDNEVILYFPGGSRFLYLNNTAAILWEQSSGDLTAAEIIEGLQAAFPQNADQIESDVRETLQSFIRHGCITLE